MTRIAICGVGNIGRVHLDNLLGMRGCEIAGLFDLRSAPANDLATLHGLRVYRSLDEMFSDAFLDAVVIATPSDSHRALTERALDAGKHVFVEKPLAGTLEDARAVVESAARRPEKVVQVGFCERFNPQFIEAKRAVDNRLFGAVRCIHSTRISPYAFGNPSWELGVLDSAVHNLDLIMWLLEEEPVRVFARGVRLYPDSSTFHSVTILLEFDDGILVTDTITWLQAQAHPVNNCSRAQMRMFGDSGSFEIDLNDRPSSLLTKTAYHQVDTVILGGSGYYGCLKLQFEGFLRSVQERAAVLAPVNDAYRAERIVLAAQESLRQGTSVEIR